MTVGFYLKVKIGKFFANLLSDVYRNKDKRHRMREKLDPLNPDRCVRYLKRYFVDVLPVEVTNETATGDFIWVCWFQGLEAAPPIVQNCIHSLHQFKKDTQKVILITADNFQDYASLPPEIVRKWRCGIIDNTHFSDIIRLHLLARHGGLWVDATCLLLSPLPKQVFDCDLFMFHSHGEFSYTLIQTCFIRSQRNHYIIRKWAAAMDKYWMKENRAINYFIPHLIFIALLQTDHKFAKEFENVPLFSDEPMHYILEKLQRDETYAPDVLEKALSRCFIQKLTYKIPEQILNNSQSIAYVLSQPHTSL